MLQLLRRAPAFTAPDQFGRIHQLKEFAGKWVVLYFYPKDDTPGCTKEACGMRDALDEFTKRGIVILGVSKDSVASHKKFAHKYQLNFYLLSDEDKKIITSYGAWGLKKFMGREYEGVKRITYIINPQGYIAKAYERVNPLVHAQEILTDVAALAR